MKRICVFCGSNLGNDPVYRDAAEALGTLIAESGLGVVFGGAKVGLMGAVADGALAAGGEVIGVIPQHLIAKEIAHPHLPQLHIVATMHDRKARMSEWSDGFIALPGGIGTFEELFEIWTWSQLGLQAKPIGIYNIKNFFQPLVDFMDQVVAQGFMHTQHREMILIDDDPERLLKRMKIYQPPVVEKWLTGDTV